MRTRSSLLGSLVDEARRKSQDFLGSVILPEISNGTGQSYGSGSAGSRFMETVRKALSSAKNSTMSKSGTNETSSNGNSSLPTSNNNSFKLRHHNSVQSTSAVDNSSSSSTLQVGSASAPLPS